MNIGPIRVTTDEAGALLMSGLTLSVLQDIAQINPEHESHRSFFDHFVPRLIIEPRVTPGDVSGWDERTLTSIVRIWAAHPMALHTEFGADSTLGSFRAAVVERQEKSTEQWEKTIRSLKDSPGFRAAQEATRLQQQLRRLYGSADLARLIEQQRQIAAAIKPFPEITRVQREIQKQAEAIAHATRGFQEMARGALAAFEEQRRYLSNIFANLPDPAELVRRSEGISSGIAALEQSGYGFTTHLLDLPFLVELGQVQPGIQGAVTTNRFAAFCRSEEFHRALRDSVGATPVLRRRWPVLHAALGAHCRREYVLAVPALLAQLEGCVSDMLVLRGEAATYRGKLYARASNGEVKKGRDGKPMRLTGLDAKLTHSRWKGDDILESVSSLIVDRLIAERNGIMHGRRLTYSQAKLATQCLMIVWVLAQEIRRRIA